MERDVGIPTTLFGGPPELGNLIKLANSQIGFMNIFAYPLFEAVTDILPGMQFAVDEIKSNQSIWKFKIDAEKAKEHSSTDAAQDFTEGFQSPRSGSPDRLFVSSPQTSHPEGLPASGSSPRLPGSPPMSTSQGTPDALQGKSSSDPRIAATSNSSLPDEPRHRSGESATPILDAYPHFLAGPKPSQRPSSTYTVANLKNAESAPTQFRLGAEASSASSSRGVENVPPVEFHASTSPFNEAIFLDGSYGTSSTSGNGPVPGIGGSHSHRSDKAAEQDVASPSTAPGGNFSRPMSTRHSAQASCARSPAPSGTPTLPTSPTDTQATSFFTEGSDGAADVREASTSELDRPGSGYSSALTGSAVSSGTKSPTGKEGKTNLASGMNGHTDAERVVRRRGSRFRFDFWKKKRSGEPSP